MIKDFRSITFESILNYFSDIFLREFNESDKQLLKCFFSFFTLFIQRFSRKVPFLLLGKEFVEDLGKFMETIEKVYPEYSKMIKVLIAISSVGLVDYR